MNAAVSIMQSVDWTRFDLEGWLYQFGAWMNSVSGTCGKTVNPIAVAMDQAVVKQKIKKLTEEQKKEIIAAHFLSDAQPKLSRSKITCQIDDNEARAVQRLILDMQGQSEVLDEWLDAIICRYFYGNSWSAMVSESRTGVDAKFDVRCGLAALHSRYGFIEFKK
ncbi:hypothetical protein M5F66_01530 [Acinetobacter sp. ANC 5033]|uniref:hypothetical protein n=1 Tax=Acinetobacter amyesii TaxID=2942470 RepID=UPI00201B6036|nr:hypothetical protein [Acinetobacter amyesii]MCL6237034.1 hypothetical protein [Acinetobacter amyesii]